MLLLDEAKDRIEKIRTSIINDSISFGRAARLYSDDTNTRNNGGQFSEPF